MKKIQGLVDGNRESEYYPLRYYFSQRLLFKLKQMKYNLECAMAVAGSSKSARRDFHDTNAAFYNLEKNSTDVEQKSNFFVERMRGLYSYDVLDSPEYIQAKTIELRLARHNRRIFREREAELARIRGLFSD